ncbi:MAG: SUMF1/EgtB/PvdO family nonheme iron enzyme [Chloroflexota bacterium]|nr:SUMF1/EgtB/PvdO family nonheme iron enzyme [Chloroflexota bacterium]
MQSVPQIRVFLASPGDVNEERAVALEVMDTLEYEPLFKRSGAGGVSIHAVAWDKDDNAPMRATLTPQTAILDGRPAPSQCDIVIVLFWGRMGTELPFPEYQKPDGSKFLSGTEWEYTDAVTSERAHGKPITLIYRRTEKPRIDLDDLDQVTQYHAVKRFFDQFRDPKTGALVGGVNEYATPEDLRLKLTANLRAVIDRLLEAEGFYSGAPRTSGQRPQGEAPPLWKGSPFPGLRAFTEADAPIFFGRGLETSELVKRVEASRFTAVVAASGSGKSSLVAAGLIPRLKANAIVSGDTGSKDWRFVRFTPGQAESPFAALFSALRDAFPEYKVDPFELPQRKKSFIDSITAVPAAFVEICDALLQEAKAPSWAEILFFVDQFEELFTLIPDERGSERAAFVALLEAIHASRRLRCIVTMRSDFMAQAIENPVLAHLINQGNYMLAAPTAGALIEMIKRPAERAGLTWDDGLPERIQAETGSDAGALAVMAYALDALYHSVGDDNRLTFAAYNALGDPEKGISGVEGAITKRADETFNALQLSDKDTVLKRVFRELVAVDERGTATRQRAALRTFDDEALLLIRTFADARLLVTDENTVEVAHEAIFRSWERLKTWIAEAQEDLILLRQVRAAAHDWQTKREREPGKDFDYLRWPAERLNLVNAMLERLKPELNEIEQDFIEPEQKRLLREIAVITTNHKRRRWIGERLATIGDPRSGIGLDERGIPQIDWLPVSQVGEIDIEGKTFGVQPFYVARYLITYPQFQAFIDAPDGFKDDRWWAEMPDRYKRQEMSTAVAQYDNYPRDSVSWYQSVAFSRWLDAKYREHRLFEQFGGGNWSVRLPTEWEWQWMAQGGSAALKYPWGNWDEHPRANTTEAGIGNRSTAVGMYSHGAAECGALDVAGNLFEWCLNDYKKHETVDYMNGEQKVLRGGSFSYDQYDAAASGRYRSDPYLGGYSYGVRLVVAAPIRAL